MSETEAGRPFDPALAARVGDYLGGWRRQPHRGARPHVIASFFDAAAGYRELTEDDLEQLLARLAFRAEEAEQLAEACGRYRRERDEARAIGRPLVAFMRAAWVSDEELAAVLSREPSALPAWIGQAPDAEAAPDDGQPEPGRDEGATSGAEFEFQWDPEFLEPAPPACQGCRRRVILESEGFLNEDGFMLLGHEFTVGGEEIVLCHQCIASLRAPADDGEESGAAGAAGAADVPAFQAHGGSERDEAVRILHRLVDHQDDPCDIDHNGYCQAHGLSSAPCSVPEAREFLARVDAPADADA